MSTTQTAEKAEAHAVNSELLEALKDVQAAYQQMFDVMPVAFQTYAHIVDAAITRAEGSI